jgi:hypothetical protein
MNHIVASTKFQVLHIFPDEYMIFNTFYKTFVIEIDVQQNLL